MTHTLLRPTLQARQGCNRPGDTTKPLRIEAHGIHGFRGGQQPHLGPDAADIAQARAWADRCAEAFAQWTGTV
ncbi:MAG: hypothetical protein AAFX99_02795 [Myxococcota bacterium]